MPQPSIYKGKMVLQISMIRSAIESAIAEDSKFFENVALYFFEKIIKKTTYFSVKQVVFGRDKQKIQPFQKPVQV